MLKTKNNKMIASIVLSSVASMSLMGAVYVVPSDIDNYKAKTDQSFYDMYQNSDSVIANGVNSNIKGQLGNMDTSGKLATGATINRVGQASVAGSPVKGGTTGGFTLYDKKYNVAVDKQGNTTLSGYGADGKSRVMIKDAQALNAREARCTASGKYGCSTYSRTADEVYFDLPTGTLSTSVVSQARNYACGKYGCSPTNNWHTSNVVKLDRQKINVLDILNEKEIQTRTYKITPMQSVAQGSSNGKYDG